MFSLLLLFSCVFAAVAYRIAERSGKILQLAFIISAALTPTVSTLLWKALLQKTAAGQIASKATIAAWNGILQLFTSRPMRLIRSGIFYLAIIGLALIIMINLNESGLRIPSMIGIIFLVRFFNWIKSKN